MFKPGWRAKLKAFRFAFKRPRLRRMMLREMRRMGVRRMRRKLRGR